MCRDRFREYTKMAVPEIYIAYQHLGSYAYGTWRSWLARPHNVPTNHITLEPGELCEPQPRPVNMQRLELEAGQPLLFTWVSRCELVDELRRSWMCRQRREAVSSAVGACG